MPVNNPILVLTSIFFFLAASSMAAAHEPRPGFLYTRSRGTCTPQYWSSRSELWPKMVPHRSTVSNVFGSQALERFRPDLTLLEAAARDEPDDTQNVFARLLKESTAALLNSYARKGYPFAAWEVKTLLIQALVSDAAAAALAERFLQANHNCA
ncbi:hypothetical protein SASPL_111175 [Salvia splendens]|uniref:Uncharacterized protein n=1 Tax=Salvia splendens TaxID=180675 RepID=A0A8X8Y683_SALSN|nr:uncharacterized protein LOC121799524 [Salvia splendens]KAG6426936.1 hypothetical protein SASPL_111175 [Salvia splendens]